MTNVITPLQTILNEGFRGNRTGFGSAYSEDGALHEAATRWLASMQFVSFGTLTLSTSHGAGCPVTGCEPPVNGLRTACHVPGVRQTESMVREYLAKHPSTVIVEEHGAIRGRKHFHLLSREHGNEYEYESTRSWPPHWGKQEIETINRNHEKAIRYVLKYFWKGQKYGYESNIGESRIWFGGSVHTGERKPDATGVHTPIRSRARRFHGGSVGRRYLSGTHDEPFRVRVTRHRRAAIAAPDYNESDFFAEAHDQWNPERHTGRFELAWEVPVCGCWHSRETVRRGHENGC